MAKADSTVEYRDIPGFPGYRVGDDGSVWCCRARGRHFGKLGAWRRLRPQITPSGYHNVTLCVENKKLGIRIHRLVLEAFVGPRPNDAECCHNDGDRANNSLTNLRWDTRQANFADKVTHGTNPAGERNPAAKLSAADVLVIRQLIAAGESQRSIARRFHVCPNTIKNIATGHSWSSIPLQPLEADASQETPESPSR